MTLEKMIQYVRERLIVDYSTLISCFPENFKTYRRKQKIHYKLKKRKCLFRKGIMRVIVRNSYWRTEKTFWRNTYFMMDYFIFRDNRGFFSPHKKGIRIISSKKFEKLLSYYNLSIDEKWCCSMKKKKYYVINTEQQPQGQLLFWRPNGNGYTTDLKEAGIYDKKTAISHNLNGRDVAVSEEELKKYFNVVTKTYAEARGFKFLNELKKQKQKELKKVETK